jgi:hypothetical protein
LVASFVVLALVAAGAPVPLRGPLPTLKLGLEVGAVALVETNQAGLAGGRIDRKDWAAAQNRLVCLVEQKKTHANTINNKFDRGCM